MSYTNESNLSVTASREMKRSALALLVFLGFIAAWAVLAPITTTFNVNGTIESETPSYQIQHERGGRISEIFVQIHDDVKAGDPLFAIDTTSEKLRIANLTARRDHLISELSEIALRLESTPAPNPNPDQRLLQVQAAFKSRDKLHQAELSHNAAQISSMKNRIASLAAERITSEELLAVFMDRKKRSDALRKSGLAIQSKLDLEKQELLRAQSSHARLLSQIKDLHSEIAETELQKAILEQRYTNELAELRVRHMLELKSTESELAELRHRVNLSTVHAPITGSISTFAFDTKGVVAAPAQTLATISRPLERLRIRVKIPTNYVDQAFTDQKGILVIPGLPQRTAPRLNVALRTIGQEPELDTQTGQFLYDATVSIIPEDLEKFESQVNQRFDLALGMPVLVTLEGRKTTLWKYLSEPISAVFDGGFED